MLNLILAFIVGLNLGMLGMLFLDWLAANAVRREFAKR